MNENIYKALVEFQKNTESQVDFDSTNPYFSSRYASLGAVIEVISNNAPKYELAWYQQPVGNGGMVGVETTIVHTSGESISNTIMVPLSGTSKNIAQEAGTIITYLRRYALVSAFGLYADEDDDGNSAGTKRHDEKSGGGEAEKKRDDKDKDAEPVKRPYEPEQLAKVIAKFAERTTPATSKDRQIFVAALDDFVFKDEDLRHRVQKFLLGKESITEADPKMVASACSWLKPSYDNETKTFSVSAMARRELELVIDHLSQSQLD